MAENNFGSPSIMHGLENLLDILYGDNYRLILIQPTKVNALAVSDLKMDVRYYKYNPRKFLLYTWLYRVTHYLPKGVEGQILKLISKSDIVVDLYGIRFCDNFNKDNKESKRRSALNAIGKFPFEYAGYLMGKRTVKNTASFGPMKCKGNQQSAKFASEHIFSIMSAREKMSYNALRNDAHVTSKVLISPDIANLFKLDNDVEKKDGVGISVSHQIIRQWSSSQGYMDCMVSLCKHITQKYKKEIILIPNEFVPGKDKNDIDVANDIQAALQKDCNINVEVADVRNMTSTQLKLIIASCDVMVASRYHACVASYSSGVPLLILGWHYKYQELSELYGQEKWILSSENCTSDVFVKTFDKFYEEKEIIREELKLKYKSVETKVVEVGKELFSLSI